jgi:hypothetical protein
MALVDRDASELFDCARYLCVCAAFLQIGLGVPAASARTVNQAEALLKERARRLAMTSTANLQELQ